MKIIFSRSKLPGSYLIRWLTFSKWSHVVAVDGDHVIEAVYKRVRRISLEDFINDHADYEIRYIDGDIDKIREQVGKFYDIGGLFMMLNPWRDDWQNPAKWFCSELVAYGTGLFEESSRVSPQMLYLVSKKTQ